MRRILIVEDEPDIREIYARALQREGHEVDVASDGRTAHDLVFEAKQPYDLIITDLFLPRMSGVEFLTAVKPLIVHQTPFVVISGVATMIEELGGLAEEAAAVLHKPVDLHTVLAAVHAALSHDIPVRPPPSPVARLQILLRQNEELFQRVRLDALTELPNRRRWLEDLRVLEANAGRHGTAFALAVVDIDNFGRFNKHYGLEVGDQAIRLVSNVLRTGCRESDAVYRPGGRSAHPDAYRYGGDEFLVVLAADDVDTAAMIMTRIGAQLAAEQVARGPGLPPEPVTISVGVAVFQPRSDMDCDALFKDAQTLMREAKADGGNTVRPAPEPRYRSAPAPHREGERPAPSRSRPRGPSR